MNQYGETAVRAAKYVNAGIAPRDAWEKASCEVFRKGSSLQKKGCPRTTFLALYDSDISSPNALHARDAREYLRSHSINGITPRELWKIALMGEEKAYNSQMDVVLALYAHDLMPKISAD